jgi:hypothetical protein
VDNDEAGSGWIGLDWGGHKSANFIEYFELVEPAWKRVEALLLSEAELAEDKVEDVVVRCRPAESV